MRVSEDALRGLCETATRLGFGAEDDGQHIPQDLVEEALLDAASANDELVAWVKSAMPYIRTLDDLQRFALQARSVRAKLALFRTLEEAPS